MSKTGVSSLLKEKSRPPRLFPVAIITLILLLSSGAIALLGQTDPLDVPFRQPQYVLHLSWTITAEWGKVPNDDYMLHPTLPDQNGMILRGAEMGWYQSGAELFAGPFTTPRQVCEAIKGLPLSKIMFIRNMIRCPAPPPPPPPEPKPEPEPITRPEPAREPEPEPEEEEKSPCDREAELSMLRQAVKQAIDLEIAGKSAMTELAILQKQIERCRLIFPDLIAELIVDKEFDPFSKGLFSAAMLSGFQSTHEQLCQKQDAVIAGVISGHQTFLDDLGAKIAQSQCPDVKKALLELKTGLEEGWELHEVKLYYTSGQREKFKALAKKLLNQNKHTYQINWLLGQDAMQNGEVGQALFAFRDARKAFVEEMKKHPQNEIPEELKQQEAQFDDLIMRLEVAFLKAVDSKVLGDAAYIRSLLNEEIERGESWWDVFTLGVVSSMGGYDWDWFWWVVVDDPLLAEALQAPDSGVESRADSVGVILSEAAVQHLGLNVIRRFRETGKTLPEIKGADNVTVIRWISEEGKKEGKEKVLSPQRAINLRTWIYHGFQNPDVLRLMSDSRQEFDRYEGRPYFSPEEFERTWYEGLTDFFLNPLTLFSMFAPYAKITSPTGLFLKWPKYMTAAEAAASKNFIQTVSAALRIPDLIRKTTADNVMLARGIQSYIKWNAEASLLKKIFVEGMIQTGAVELAAAVGGLPGQVVAQVLTSLGVGDLDLAADVLQSAGVTGPAAQQLARSLKNVLEESIELRTQARVVDTRNWIAEVLSQIDAGTPLSEATKSKLKADAQEYEALCRDLVGKANSDLMRLQTYQLDLASRAMIALADEELPTARVLVSSLDDVDSPIVRTIRQMQDAITVAEASGGPLKVRPADEPELVATEGDKVTSTDKACKRFSLIWKQHDVRFAAADQALREGNTGAAFNHYKAAVTRLSAELEQARKAGNRAEAKAALEQLMLNIESYAVVKDISHSVRHVKPFGSIADNLLLAEIVKKDAEPIKKEISRIFQRVREIAEEKGEEEAKAFLNKSMPLLKSSEGAATKDLPRLVTVNGQRYVLKDYADNIQKAKGELFASSLANHNKLKVDTPGCALIAWRNAQDETSFGIIQRFVPDASDLGTVDRGAVLAMRKQVAQDRVLSMLLGDPDRRSRNFLLAATGEPYCIDRAESMIIEQFFEYKFIDNTGKITDDTKQAIVKAMERKYKMYLSRMQERWPIIEAVNTQITFQDLDDMIRQVESLTEEDFRGLLRRLYDDGSEQFNQALQTLTVRQGALRSLFSGPPSGMGADAATIRRTGILQGLRDRLRPMLWNPQPVFVACP